MPLTLILGPANAAKAREVLGAYALAARRGALLVVPTAADADHYERELAGTGALLGQALTFPALIDEIALRAHHHRLRLTALQREYALRQVIASVPLRRLAATATTGGFVRALGRLIAELSQARIAPARFGAALQTWAGASAERLAYARELAALYTRYVAELERVDADDAERFAWGALDALRSQPSSWGATPVFLYGFDDLTAVELDAVRTLCVHAGAAVTVSLTYEPGRPALAARAGVVEELRALAQTVRQLPALDTFYEPSSRSSLHRLERHLFEPEAPQLDPGGAVVLMEAGSQRLEAEMVAAEVLAALREGVEPRDLVVVCRSLRDQAGAYERALERLGVVATSARHLPLTNTALGRALLGLARYALSPAARRDPADLISYLRHPGVATGVDEFERLVRRSGGRTEQALRACEPGLRPALEQLARLRESADPLGALVQSARWLLAAPDPRTARLLERHEQTDARAASAVIGALGEVSALAETSPSAPELLELLERLEVRCHGEPAPGAVLIAEPLAIRARRFRRVFVTGLCAGEFPSPQAAVGDPFLGEERRRELALASGLVLAAPGDPLDRERYLLYACASRATERLYLSYRSSDEDGTVVAASPFLDDLTALLGEGWRERRRRRLLSEVVWQQDSAPSERERLLAAAFAAAVKRPVAEPHGDGRQTRQLSAVALAHVRHRQVVSASALELFAACPVRWLVERQLQPSELAPDSDELARGSVMHAVLAGVFARLGGALTPRTLPLAESLLAEELETAGSGTASAKLAPGQPAAVRAALMAGIEADLRRYLRTEAGGGGASVALATELRFGLDAGEGGGTGQGERLAPIVLSDGHESVLLAGIIDRVDASRARPDTVLVRDYKSSTSGPSWPSARWLADGQLQVALYMIAAERLLERRAVAGLYQPLTGDDLRPRGAYLAGSAEAVGTVSSDELDADALAELLSEAEAQAVKIARELARGELTPCPERCGSDGSCRHPGICWALG